MLVERSRSLLSEHSQGNLLLNFSNHLIGDAMKQLVQIMLSRVFTFLYPSTNNEFESIKTTWLFVISLSSHRGKAILSHLTTPPLLELLVILDNDVFGIELSESIFELRVVGEIAEKFDRRTFGTVATQEYCSDIGTDILTKFPTASFHHQVIPQEMLYEEGRIRIFGIVDLIETV